MKKREWSGPCKAGVPQVLWVMLLFSRLLCWMFLRSMISFPTNICTYLPTYMYMLQIGLQRVFLSDAYLGDGTQINGTKVHRSELCYRLSAPPILRLLGNWQTLWCEVICDLYCHPHSRFGRIGLAVSVQRLLVQHVCTGVVPRTILNVLVWLLLAIFSNKRVDAQHCVMYRTV